MKERIRNVFTTFFFFLELPFKFARHIFNGDEYSESIECKSQKRTMRLSVFCFSVLVLRKLT